MAKLPYPDFSPRDNDWLYVYDQQISFFTDPYNGSHNYLLHKTMRELKDAGVEGYDLFGDPAAKAEDDLKNHVPHKMKVRYGPPPRRPPYWVWAQSILDSSVFSGAFIRFSVPLSGLTSPLQTCFCPSSSPR